MILKTGDEFPVSWSPAERSGGVISVKPSNNAQDRNFHVPGYKLRASDRPLKKRMLKMPSPYGLSARKLRAIEKENVDTIAAYPKESLDGKNMCASSLNLKSNGLLEMKQTHVFAHSRFKSSELISSDTDACSVGSCDTDTRCLHTLYSGCFVPNDDLGSDAESFCSLFPKRKMELEVSIRGLELHAYRTTLEALYASGPLNWEQEAMLTNLRIMLHVSNDEHLKELKRLIST